MLDREISPEVVKGFLKVGVCNIVDVLDHQLGIRSWMSHEIKPVTMRARIAGRAVTLLEVPCDGAKASDVDGFYAAADLTGPGCVLVASMSGDKTLSIMGDLVVLAMHARGCEGAVLDGAVRDIDNMIKMGFPVFASAVSPVDKTNKAMTVGYNIPITCGGVQVNPGDIVVADWDGVAVVPADKAEDVLERALKVVQNEDAIVQAIREKAKTTKLADIFAEFE